MKTVPDHAALHFCWAGSGSDGPFDSSLLGRIGDDLRQHFDDALEEEMPCGLRQLAETIDARLMSKPHDE